MTANGRVCIVTGAGRGLGRAIARHLGSNGWSLALCARGLDALTAIAGKTIKAVCSLEALVPPPVGTSLIHEGRPR